MKIEIWSDVVCPWCYIGKRNLEAALAEFAHADRVTVEWRSFELDPTTPERVGLSMDEALERKYGMSPDEASSANRHMTELAAKVGLDYHLDRVQIGNTFNAHRLIHLAGTVGSAGGMKERLLAAYFTEGRSVSDPQELAELAAEVGLDPARTAEVLEGDEFAAEVRADEARATELGCTGVPFLVIDERMAIPGAQPPDVILRLLGRVWDSSEEAASASLG
ncbi:MAG: DsbA family oxidoreductase [Acidimicrobiales bacterium]|jgi:predicted DsbA family dithiol-disulfide isomerase